MISASIPVLLALAPTASAAAGGGSSEPPPPSCSTMTLTQAMAIRPRPTWPLSTSRVTGRAPTVAWESCAPGFQVQLCYDRDCTWVFRTDLVTGATRFTSPVELLPVGAVFWRVRPATLSGRSWWYGPWSPAWEMVLPDVSAPLFNVGGSVYDADLDRYVDFVVDHDDGDDQMWLYRTPLGVPDAGSLLGGPNRGWYAASAGDLDGDGYPELALLDHGDVKVFRGGPSGPLLPPTLVTSFSVPLDSAAWLQGAGDVNGDGYGDLLVSPGDDRVDVYYGRQGGIPAGAGPSLTLGATAEALGVFVGYAGGGVGDVNADGYADIAAGGSGMVLWYGGPSGPVDANAVVLHAWPDSGEINGTLSDPADLDGDGYFDVVSSGTDGIPYAWTGGPNGLWSWWPSYEFTWPGLPETEYIGTTYVSASGDLDGDGLDDLVAGGQRASEVYLYLSQNGQVHTTPSVTLTDTTDPQRYLGYGGVQIVGDVDGNGYDDVLMGIAYDVTVPHPAGEAWLLTSDGTPSQGEKLVIPVTGSSYVAHR